MVNGLDLGPHRVDMVGAMAIDDTGHPIEDRLVVTGHEETITTEDHHQHRESGDLTGAAMVQTPQHLLHTHLAMGKEVIVVTATGTGLHQEIRIFPGMKEGDLEKNGGHGIRTIDQDAGPETRGSREMVLPMIVRSVDGATATGIEQEILATLDATDETAEHGHGAQTGGSEIGRAKGNVTSTGDRTVCISKLGIRSGDEGEHEEKCSFVNVRQEVMIDSIWRMRSGKTDGCTICMASAGHYGKTWPWPCEGRLAGEVFIPAFARRYSCPTFIINNRQGASTLTTGRERATRFLRYSNEWHPVPCS